LKSQFPPSRCDASFSRPTTHYETTICSTQQFTVKLVRLLDPYYRSQVKYVINSAVLQRKLQIGPFLAEWWWFANRFNLWFELFELFVGHTVSNTPSKHHGLYVGCTSSPSPAFPSLPMLFTRSNGGNLQWGSSSSHYSYQLANFRKVARRGGFRM
jgi:hypothetical protein